MTTLELLDNWHAEHKARAVNIDIEDGYGSCVWRCELIGEHGIVHSNQSWIEEDELRELGIEDGKDFIVDEKLNIRAHLIRENAIWVCNYAGDDWGTLDGTILAGIMAYRKIYE